jgi:mannosyl-3-phosphoglycerate phosphatase
MRIIFTDLDGTLLSHITYSFHQAEETLRLVQSKKIPIVVCTSKTRAEIEFWREKLDNHHPFISENGGGIFIPKHYFDFDFKYDDETLDYYVIQLGVEYHRLVKVVQQLKQKYRIASFHEMTSDEISLDTGLSRDQAQWAKKRDFDIPFKILDEEQKEHILQEIKQNNLNYTAGGRYYHIMGDNDKGKAVQILSDLYRKKYGDITSIGLGNSENDFEMLDHVDHPYLVIKKDGTYASPNYNHAEGIGPEGWSNAVKKELEL